MRGRQSWSATARSRKCGGGGPMKTITTLLLTLSVASAAIAQDLASERATRDPTERERVSRLGGSRGRDGLARSGAEAILEGATDDTKATARLGAAWTNGWAVDT